jgi:hypothetical protein
MPEVMKSSLSEVNKEVNDRMFELLNFVAPEYWTDPSRIVYSPVDDLDYASTLYQEHKGSENAQNLQIPFAYFTRATQQAVGDTYDFAKRPWAEWISTGREVFLATGENKFQVKFIPATLQYFLKVFDNRVENTEALLDRTLHKGIREKSRKYTYESEVFGTPMLYVIRYGNPSYDRPPNLKDRTNGKGRLYSIIIPMEVDCALGEGVPAKRIEKVDVGYYYHIPEKYGDKPTPENSTFLDKYEIDSNTPAYPDGGNNQVFPDKILKNLP